MYNDSGTLSWFRVILEDIEFLDVTEDVDESITGLKRRIECAKVGNALRR